MADDNKKIVGFKKFTDIKSKPKVEEVEISSQPETDSDRPMNPNTPNKSKKIERPASRKNIIPQEQDVDLPSDDPKFVEKDEKKNESKVETIGKVAKFPRNTKPSKAFNFLENVRVSKKSIWYIIVERMDAKGGETLQMVKYNYREGVDLNKFVNELKSYYLKEYKDNSKICESISKIKVSGSDKYSIIESIPLVEINGTKLITKLTEDLIKLLSK